MYIPLKTNSTDYFLDECETVERLARIRGYNPKTKVFRRAKKLSKPSKFGVFTIIFFCCSIKVSPINLDAKIHAKILTRNS